MSNLYRRKDHMPEGRRQRRMKRVWGRLVRHHEDPEVAKASDDFCKIFETEAPSKLAYGVREIIQFR